MEPTDCEFAQTLGLFVKGLPSKKGIEKNLWAKKFIQKIIYSKENIQINFFSSVPEETRPPNPLTSKAGPNFQIPTAQAVPNAPQKKKNKKPNNISPAKPEKNFAPPKKQNNRILSEYDPLRPPILKNEPKKESPIQGFPGQGLSISSPNRRDSKFLPIIIPNTIHSGRKRL